MGYSGAGQRPRAGEVISTGSEYTTFVNIYVIPIDWCCP